VGPVRSLRRAIAAAVTGLLMVTVLTACGDDAGSGSDQASPEAGADGTESPDSDTAAAVGEVCDARDTVTTAMAQVTEDVRAANFGDARTSLQQLSTAVGDLTDSVGSLADQQRQAVQPEVDQLRADLEALSQAESVADLRAALASAGAELRSALETIGSDLDCPS
jgi:hypothetical protein